MDLTFLTPYVTQIIAICLPMLAAVWLVQRIKIARYRAGHLKPHNHWLRFAAFLIVLIGTMLTWHRLVAGNEWVTSDYNALLDGFFIGIVSGLGTPFMWQMFIAWLQKVRPEFAEILTVRYPDYTDDPNGTNELGGKIVTVLGVNSTNVKNKRTPKQSRPEKLRARVKNKSK
jgi:hypothetical protein